ncbi:hypothetical protein J7T55_005988 [Diaporthe amygdali]|uniref:uncharacterized protein n=1 Tax=Phomopsis amygdali TaxID=1214568 RepID=UPI0022FE35B8|nr:uncharacterized protein J7T55_005988 [Diaporthe amygdali]KAJ0124648.1 hypothetical protein J7T55_005988 [Diaporthe amygdali]
MSPEMSDVEAVREPGQLKWKNKDTFLSERDRLEAARSRQSQTVPLPLSPGVNWNAVKVLKGETWAIPWESMWPEFYLCSTSVVTGRSRRRAELEVENCKRHYPRDSTIDSAAVRSSIRDTPLPLPADPSQKPG